MHPSCKKFTYNFPLDRVKLINDLHTDFFSLPSSALLQPLSTKLFCFVDPFFFASSSSVVAEQYHCDSDRQSLENPGAKKLSNVRRSADKKRGATVSPTASSALVGNFTKKTFKS